MAHEVGIPTRFFRRLTSGAAVAALFAAAGARADTISLRSGETGGTLAIKGHIDGIEAGQVLLTSESGVATHRPLAQVVQLQIDDEPALSAAEAAFAQSRFDSAVDGYLKTIAATNKPWLKDYANFRLADAAAKSGRFDAAAGAYVALVRIDVKTAEAHKPQMPAAGSTYLDGAAASVSQALEDRSLSPEQRQALLAFLIEIQKARGDGAAVAAAAAQLQRLAGAGASSGGDAGGTTAALADGKLAAAGAAVDAANYPQALSLIDQNKALFTTPTQQADALWTIARAKDGAASAGSDPQALADAALAYMRVVAHFKDATDAPHVPDALMRTAAIQEKLGDARAAGETYASVVAGYKGSPQAAEAQRQADRLKRLPANP